MDTFVLSTSTTVLLLMHILLGFAISAIGLNSARQNVENICSSNCRASLCIGLDSSNGLSRLQFEQQKEVLKEILDSLEDGQRFLVSAVQYSSAAEVVIESTRNFSEAIADLQNLLYDPSPFSILSAPIVFCDSALRKEATTASLIILFSSGKFNLGGDPGTRADIFRKRADGEILVITFGSDNFDLLKQVAGGKNENIINLSRLGVMSTTTKTLNFICRHSFLIRCDSVKEEIIRGFVAYQVRFGRYEYSDSPGCGAFISYHCERLAPCNPELITSHISIHGFPIMVVQPGIDHFESSITNSKTAM